MSDGSDRTGDRMRAIAREAREAPWDATATTVADGPRRRRPGAPVAPRRRLALRASAGVGAIGASWRQLLRGPGTAVRRLAVAAFVAVLLAGAVAGVLVSHGTTPPGQHALVGGPTATPPTSTTPRVTTTTKVAGVTITTTTVRSRPSGTTGAPTTTTTLPAATTTTTTPAATLAGYQEVDASASASCSSSGSGTVPNCSNGGPTATATAECPGGDKVLGGGGSTTIYPSQTPGDSSVPPSASLSASNPTGADTAWTATGVSQVSPSATMFTLTVTSYAICAQLP
jgi:hypothetical protein